MAANMDRSLDEILAEKRKDNPRGNNRRGRRDGGYDSGNDRATRRNERNDYPRDGIRKVAPPALPPSQTFSASRLFSDSRQLHVFDSSYRDETRNLDSEWVHDRYDDDNRGGRYAPRRRRESPELDSNTSKLKVENLHYDLNEKDLDGLFNRIGPVSRLVLLYDRAGRSEGVAYVTYEEPEDARQAIREFDGANANGQPIRLYLVPNHGGRGRGGGGGGGGGRNPFDTAVMPGRPLSERVSRPSARGRSRSPGRHQDVDDTADRGIDRYVPGSRNRSPNRRRERGGGGGGRRAGARHETGGRSQPSDGPRGGNRRPKKTQEELDAEMADYFGGGGDSSATPAAAAPASNVGAPAAAGGDDIDMIE